MSLKWIAKQTCQNFHRQRQSPWPPALHIISASEVPLSDAYRAFFTALRENQMIALRVGRFWKIIPETTARQSPITTITNENLRSVPSRDEMGHLSLSTQIPRPQPDIRPDPPTHYRWLRLPLPRKQRPDHHRLRPQRPTCRRATALS
jgi:hypothetical protein